ncbi:MAG: PaaX family transcriptional regulator C-terminal domain-containing protein [Anaerolineales bacterium]|jgi:phenylacetic acid degradation operon negative regulatory protein
MISRPHIRTQILIFTLFGEYIAPRGESVWTANLLGLLKVLGVTERAARSVLSRMSRKGWLVSKRQGRYSRYSLTKRGLGVVRGGEERIFEPRRTEWDGLWHMVVYSIPEDKRRLRSALRKRLGWLGFGSLAPGTWVSPNDRCEEVETQLDDLGARNYAVYFGGMELHFATNQEIVKRCWGLDVLNRDYTAFLQNYEPAFLECRQKINKGIPLQPANCFRQRFWLTLEYSQFPRRDPNLPPDLLPSTWQGSRASQVFTEFHRLLKEPSERFVNDVLSNCPTKHMNDTIPSME